MKNVLQKSAEVYKPRGRLDPAGFARHVEFHTYPPPADLVQFIEHFWTIRWNTADGTPYHSEEVMHRPYVDVFFSAQESGIQGTFRGKRVYTAAGMGRIIGIRFHPAAFHAFYGRTLAELQDKIGEIGSVFPQVEDHYIEHLLSLDDDAAIAKLLDLVQTKRPKADPNIELINQVITAIEADKDLRTVAAVAKTFARSERWLQQLFQDYLGIGLKWLLQRHRLLAAAEQIRASENPNWTAIAYDLGYSSQQHFINDFKQVVGKTPTQYKRELTKPDQQPPSNK